MCDWEYFIPKLLLGEIAYITRLLGSNIELVSRLSLIVPRDPK